MTGDGIAEVPDPSGLFLSRGAEPVPGTCVTVAMEGRRAMPVEVQALVVKTSAPNPRRVTNGVDSSRVAMLLAVLEKRAGLSQLAERDVYVSTVGGIKLTEPASDLAIALAIASAYRDVAIPHDLVAYGEISLAGEIRAVSASNQRANEATRLGFGTLIDASSGSMRDAVTEALTDTAQPRRLKSKTKSNTGLVP
jgi:DNA repair protein RadA/Sms